MTAKRCPAPDELLAFTLGKLPDASAETIAGHLEDCPTCEATVSRLDGMADSFIVNLRQPVAGGEFLEEPQFAAALSRLAKGQLASPVAAANLAEAGGPREEGGQPSVSHTGLAVLGEYQLVEELGRGGMGAVYKAEHTKLKRIVALKVLPKGRMDNPSAVARFEREMEAVGRLDHPNIVRAMDAREIDGTCFLVMEYVTGMNLHELVRYRGSLGVADACALLHQVAVGLQFVHEHGMVHRDIKPSNLILTPAGQVKILDLGLALLGARASSASSAQGNVTAPMPVEEMTAAGQAIGTADYIAPEQVTDSHSVDIRADIYSLGCTLYKLLTGQPPFTGPQYKSDFSKMMGHVRDEIPSIASHRPYLPKELVAVVDRMLAKDPAKRFATPAQVAEVIAPFAQGSDLRRLAAEAEQDRVALRESSRSRASTFPGLSSALAGTQPTLPVQSAPVRRRWKTWAVATALSLLALGLCLTIIIRIKDKEGRDVAAIEVPDGDTVKIETKKETAKSVPPAGQQASATPGELAAPIAPLTYNLLPEVQPVKVGAPLSEMAWIARPPQLAGVQAWTLDCREHRGVIRSLTYSPGGRLLASGGEDGTIRLRDSKDGRPLRILYGHDGGLWSVAWSPDGRYLASGGEDGTVRIWEAASGRQLRVFQEHQGPVRAVAWSPDGGTICSGGVDRMLCFWQLPAGRRLAKIKVEQAVFTVAWSPDDKHIALGGDGKTVEVRDAKTKKPLQTLKHDDVVRHLAFSPQGNTIAAADFSGALRLWDVGSGQRLHPGLKLGSPLAFNATTVSGGLAFSPDGKHLAYGCADTFLRVLEVSAGRSAFDIKDHAVAVAAVAWSPDGKTIASSSEEPGCSLRFWNVERGSSQNPVAGYSLPRSTCSLTWSPDGKTVAIGDGKAIWLWTPTAQEPPRRFYDCKSYHSFRWSSDGAIVVLGPVQDPGKPEGNRQVRVVNPRMTVDPARYGDVVYSPDNALAAQIGEKRGTFRLVDVSSGRVLRTLDSGARELRQITFSPDGKRIIAADYEFTAWLWDCSSGQLLRKVENRFEGNAGLGAVAWSPDGKMLAGYTPWGLSTFDASTGKGLRFFEQGVAGCHWFPITWTPDGKTLVAMKGWDCSRVFVRFWDCESGKMNETSAPNPWYAGVNGFAFSPDCRLLAVTDSPGTPNPVLPIWDLPNRRIRAIIVLLEHDGRALWVAAGAEGNYCTFGDTRDDFVYVVQTEAGQETLSPEEFSRRYGWQNDPSKVLSAGGATVPAAPVVVGKPANPPQVAVPKIAAEPQKVAEGKPLSPLALVSRPAKIPGIKSWTIETRGHRYGSFRVSASVLSYSPDGRFLAATTEDDAIRLWDAANGQLVRILVGAGPGIAWSPDGTLLASAGPENSIKIWEAGTGRVLKTIKAHFRARSLDWSPDGKLLAAEQPGANVEVWNLESGDYVDTALRAQSDHTYMCICIYAPPFVKWSPDGSVLAVACERDTLRRWDRKSRSPLTDLSAPQLWNIAWSPDNKLILSGSYGLESSLPKVRIWENQTGRLIREFDNCSTAFWSQEGKVILVRGGGNQGVSSLELIDGESGRKICDSNVPQNRPISIGFCPDRKSVAVGWDDGTIRVLDPSRGQLRLTSPPGHPAFFGILWLLDHQKIVTVGSESCSPLFDLVKVNRLNRDLDGRHLIFSPDGQLVASGSGDPGAMEFKGDIGVMEFRSGKHLFSAPGEWLVWSPDSKKLALFEEKRISIWSVESGKILQTIQHDRKGKRCVGLWAWSPDGKQLAGGETLVTIWDAESGKLVREAHKRDRVWGVSWSPAGKTLAAREGANMPDVISLVDAATGELIDTLRPNQGPINAVKWSPDGKRLTTAGQDRTLKEWNLETGQSTVVATAPSSDAFSPNLEYVAENCRTFVRIWETTSGRLCGAIMPLHEGHFLIVSPDGHYRGSPSVERKIVYVALTDSGEQQFFSPKEFSKRFGWRNDPSKVRLLNDAEEQKK
jgi:WD40 repeat protein/serine/threonine protein kinase